MIISVVCCVALMGFACMAWLLYWDILASIAILLAVAASCIFEEGRKEYISNRNNTRRHA